MKQNIKPVVYVVKSRLDQHNKKLFISVHLELDKALDVINSITQGLPQHARSLVYYDTYNLDEIY